MWLSGKHVLCPYKDNERDLYGDEDGQINRGEAEDYSVAADG